MRYNNSKYKMDKQRYWQELAKHYALDPQKPSSQNVFQNHSPTMNTIPNQTYTQGNPLSETQHLSIRQATSAPPPHHQPISAEEILGKPAKTPLWKSILKHSLILSLLILITLGVMYWPTINREFSYWWRNVSGVERSSAEYGPNALFPGDNDEAASYLDSDDDSRQAGPIIPPDNRIVIDKIEVNAPVILMDTTTNDGVLKWIEQGVGHYPNTALPGQPGNAFLTGHSSFWWWDKGKYKFVFQHLEDLVIGDVITLYYKQQRFDYKVYDIDVIKPNGPQATQVFDQDPYLERPIITLMTCTPVGTSLNRLIVRAEQINPDPHQPTNQNSLLDEEDDSSFLESSNQSSIQL